MGLKRLTRGDNNIQALIQWCDSLCNLNLKWKVEVVKDELWRSRTKKLIDLITKDLSSVREQQLELSWLSFKCKLCCSHNSVDMHFDVNTEASNWKLSLLSNRRIIAGGKHWKTRHWCDKHQDANNETFLVGKQKRLTKSSTFILVFKPPNKSSNKALIQHSTPLGLTCSCPLTWHEKKSGKP